MVRTMLTGVTPGGEMTTLNIAILVIVALVLLTFVWSVRSARKSPPPDRDELRRRREERDRL